MVNPEKVPDYSGEENEIETRADDTEMSARDYKNESLKGHADAREALESELIDWKATYKQRKAEGMTDEQDEKYSKRIEELKAQIAMAAKEKNEVAEGFEKSEKNAV